MGLCLPPHLAQSRKSFFLSANDGIGSDWGAVWVGCEPELSFDDRLPSMEAELVELAFFPSMEAELMEFARG